MQQAWKNSWAMLEKERISKGLWVFVTIRRKGGAQVAEVCGEGRKTKEAYLGQGFSSYELPTNYQWSCWACLF